MNSVLTEDFMACFGYLPAEVREPARRAYKLWRANSAHPGLRHSERPLEVQRRKATSPDRVA